MQNPHRHTPDDLKRIFSEHYGSAPSHAVRAPGRVNLIGEHIDYNGGLVLPMAIERETKLVGTIRNDGRFVLRSLQFPEMYEGPLPSSAIASPKWGNYVFGVVHELIKQGRIPDVASFGFNAVYDGDVPLGSGLSSSAAIEVATAWFLHQALGTSHSKMDLAVLSQQAERNFVGVNCGIMDQAISACGERGCAVSLDCATLRTEAIPLQFKGDCRFLIVHSGVHRGLSGSAYNERRAACEEALGLLNKHGGVTYDALCAVPLETLEKHKDALSSVLYRRARHAISEQGRVQKAQVALKNGDAGTFGTLLNSSHESLTSDYEVSIPELDDLTAWLRQRQGVYGSRLTGAGFGGCTVSLIDGTRAESILNELPRFFESQGREMSLAFVTQAAAGMSDL